ncbi:MAG: PilZ domain-containing protein [Acidobacteriota bacterium]|nr:PilZ domain-containing protein [Acidobacteriota bacterium]
MARSEQRYKVDFLVTLNWQDSRGVRRATARCTDLSASGALLESRDAFPVQSPVVVSSDQFGRMGHAVVRSCRRAGMKYEVGLQFTESFQLADPSRQAILRGILKPAP